jgi:hypothetical protein
MVKFYVLAGILLLGTILAAVIYGRDFDNKDDAVYNQIVGIKGSVQLTGDPHFGTTVGSGQYIIFQKDDCKKCLIATRTDEHGNYEINVARGRYKVIVREVRGGWEPSHDLLAPDQPRYIDAYSVLPQGNRFDIKLFVGEKKQ